jgi:hypothetical protein
VVQKIGASYVMKKVTDYVTAPPPQAAQREAVDETERAPRAPDQAPADPLHGQVITDEDGQTVGTARRVPGVAVYVIAPAYANATAEFERALDDPETRLLFHREDDRLVGLIYVPDPSQAPEPVAGMRADDI